MGIRDGFKEHFWLIIFSKHHSKLTKLPVMFRADAHSENNIETELIAAAWPTRQRSLLTTQDMQICVAEKNQQKIQNLGGKQRCNEF